MFDWMFCSKPTCSEDLPSTLSKEFVENFQLGLRSINRLKSKLMILLTRINRIFWILFIKGTL